MRKEIVLLLIILNMLGFFYGLYSYLPEFAERSFFEMFFVADCPISVLLFTVCMILVLKKIKVPELLADFTFIYLIKNGLLAILVFVLYQDYYTLTFSFLAGAAHLFMILEAFLLLPFLSKKPYALLILTFLDFSDFFLGTRYWLPYEKFAKLIYYCTTFLNFGLFFFKNKLIKHERLKSFYDMLRLRN